MAFKGTGQTDVLSYDGKEVQFLKKVILKEKGVEFFDIQYHDRSFWIVGGDNVLNKLQIQLE